MLPSAASEGRNQTGFEQKAAKATKPDALRPAATPFVSFVAFCSNPLRLRLRRAGQHSG
jgi:hypothetical protein